MDYDNVFWSILEYYGNDPLIDTKFKNKKGEILSGNFIDIINQRYDDNFISIFNAYADFQQITRFNKGSDHMYKLQARRVTVKNVFGNTNQNENRKNASDIELSIDVCETLFTKPEIDTYVIVSADSDMIPIINRLLYSNKKVVLYYLKEAISRDGSILSYAKENIPIDGKEVLNLEYKKLTNKEIEAVYLNPVLDELINLDRNNKKTGNYIGYTWYKNRLLNNGININGNRIELSGENIIRILDYMYNQDLIRYGQKTNKSIDINKTNKIVKQIINPQKDQEKVDFF